LRVKRATPTERREKKQERKREQKEKFKQEKQEGKKHHHHQRKHRDDKETSSRELKKITPFVEGAKKSLNQTNDNVDIQNRIAARGKKEKMRVQQELVESRDKKTSRAQNFKNKVLKEQPTLNQMLKTKREKRKKLNM
jgi:hypothetical protein